MGDVNGEQKVRAAQGWTTGRQDAPPEHTIGEEVRERAADPAD